MTRREFMVKAQLERFRWAKQTDPESLAKFDAATKARTGDGARKLKSHQDKN